MKGAFPSFPDLRSIGGVGKSSGLNDGIECPYNYGLITKSDTPRRAGGLMSGAASKAVVPLH